MSHDLYLYVECGGDMVHDPEVPGAREWDDARWFIERVPYVFALLTGRAGYDMPDALAPLAPARGLPPDWTWRDFEGNTRGICLRILAAHERASLTWYTLAELQTARGRHPYLDALLDRIERATPDPEQTRVIAWVD
jgi:hypothetical protein